jgi:predicted nuclease with RNAse H fold
MITLGIDMSSQPKNTSACQIDWSDPDQPVITAFLSCDDTRLDELIQDATVVGIDAPFGWPKPFQEAVASWSSPEWTIALRDDLRFRKTDKCLAGMIGQQTLSVSSDLIALPAMRTMALLHRHNVTDRSGDGRFYEVYPAASLKQWKLPHNGYKNGGDALTNRKKIVTRLSRSIPTLSSQPEFYETDHALDALIASLTARAVALNLTMPLKPEHRELGKTEGWIHLPNTCLACLFDSAPKPDDFACLHNITHKAPPGESTAK